jgi:hypothetical protein
MEQHKHFSHDKPGDCADCGMTLVAAVETESDSAEYLLSFLCAYNATPLRENQFTSFFYW